MLKLIKKFIKTPSSYKLLLLEATCWLAITRFSILVFPFKYLAKNLGAHMQETEHAPLREHEKLHLIFHVVQAVQSMAKHLPWQCKCLVIATSAKVILRRRGVASTLYLGVAKEDQLLAHAWLRVGDTIVTGDGELDKYAVVSYFAD